MGEERKAGKAEERAKRRRAQTALLAVALGFAPFAACSQTEPPIDEDGPNGKFVVVGPADGDTAEDAPSKKTPTTKTAAQSGYKAFLVGADDYDDAPKLVCVKNDVEAFAERLIEIGVAEENVTVLKSGGRRRDEPTKANIENRFAEFVESLRPGDFAVVFLSGHGLQAGESGAKEAFFAPLDLNPEDLFGSSVSIDKMLKRLDASRAKSRWMIVDACRNVPDVWRQASGVRTRSLVGAKGLTSPIDAPESTALLQSCQAGTVSYEAGEHGFFTLSLLEALDKNDSKADKDNDGVLSFTELIAYVTERTDALARENGGASQRPSFSGEMTDFPVLNTRIEGLAPQRWREANALYEEAAARENEGKYSDALDKIRAAREINSVNEDYKNLENRVANALKQIDDAARKAQKEAAQAEAELKKQLEAERKAREEAEKAAAQAEAERKAKEEAEKAEAERQAAAEKAEAERQAAAQAAAEKAEAERQAAAHAAAEAEAARELFRVYDSGDGVAKNPKKAFAALEKFATRPDCKDASAKFALAVAYAYGYGVEQDAKKAFALFKKQEEELEEGFPAVPLHEALLLALALCYERGFGVAEDVSQTIELYEKGLALGYPTATANYGWCCGVGRGVAKNTAEATRYYRRASDLGETGASCNLGSCYENGAYGLAKDAKKAFELYKKAADAGAPRGMREVARCYENGVGVGRSATEAAKWRERAGNAPAFFIEPIPVAENLAPPQGLRLSDLGLFVGRNIPSAASSSASTASSVAWPETPAAGTQKSLDIKGASYNFRYCPAGTFTMGSPAGEAGHSSDETQHKVTLTQGFWMLETEVTQALWESVTGENSMTIGAWKGPNKPMGNVSWEDCQEFIAKLNSLGIAPAGLKFRLPTEAEWEYACRAGASGPYAGSSLDSMGWYKDNSGNDNHDVGEKSPNAWGLYDMHGNVLEWCSDWFDFGAAPKDGQTDPTGPASGSSRVSRGGAWNFDAKDCRSAYRGSGSPDFPSASRGFRLVLGREDESSAPVAPSPAPSISSSPSSAGSPSGSASSTGTSAASSAWTDAPAAGTQKSLDIKGASYNFRYCPAGTFTMGSPASEPGRYSDETQHKVTLTRGFWMLETEVTQALWESITGENPVKVEDNQGPRKPVGNVSWEDCQKFIAKLNSEGYAPAGLKFRLPTEAEWEYACRAGTSGSYAGSGLDSMGWYKDNSDDDNHEVGKKAPNAWGLYDMHGNAREWCSDRFDADAYDAASQTDPTGPYSGSRRVLRGGGWNSSVECCRAAFRGGLGPKFRNFDVGFRLVLEREDESSAPVAPSPVPPSPEPVAPSPVPPAPPISVAWTDAPAAGTQKSLDIEGATYNFRYCPAGTFTMGSPESEPVRFFNETQHEVKLTNGFWMLETEVTQALWESVMGSNPSWFSSSGGGSSKVSGMDTSNFPVESVSWNECQEFIEKLNAAAQLPEGFKLRLPTEAEWEYACRAGTTTPYFWGSSLNGDKANCHGNKPYGMSTKGKYLARTTKNGSYDANRWGLHDMHGNVWEWCEDVFASYNTLNGVQGMKSVTLEGLDRVLRGGSWYSDARHCRAARRGNYDPAGRNSRNGFRLVLGR